MSKAEDARLVAARLDPRRKQLLALLASHTTPQPYAWAISPRLDRQTWRSGKDEGEELVVLELKPATADAPPYWRIVRSRVTSRRERFSELCRLDGTEALADVLFPVTPADKALENQLREERETYQKARHALEEKNAWLEEQNANLQARLDRMDAEKGGRPLREVAASERDRILALRAGGFSINKIAEALHISNRVIMRVVKTGDSTKAQKKGAESRL